MSKQNGIIILNTGNGKGKTTAALGTAFRAIGHGFRVCIIQFIKGQGNYGERITARDKFDSEKELEWHIQGEGFTWNSKDLEIDKTTAKRGFQLAKEKIESGDYDLIILDELTYLPNYNFLEVEEIISVLRKKPSNLNIIITGRDAKQELIDIADTVTEMKAIKHAYDNGIKAIKGIEF